MEQPDIYVVTTDAIPGVEIIRTLGLVLESHFIDFGLDVPIADYTLRRVVESGKSLGANGVTGLRISISQGLVIAYETAVIVHGRDGG